MSKNYLSGSGLSYHLPNHDLLFENLDFDLKFGEKVALIGENGCGKSTLFKIINGLLFPDSGKLVGEAKISYLPQAVQLLTGKVDDVLGIRPKLDALERINSAQATENDWEIVGNDWEIADKLQQELTDWGLEKILFSAPFEELSGGEKEKLLLIKTLLFSSEIILLDEPTNNLDAAAKKLLSAKLMNLEQGVLMITHDRQLLNEVEMIWEMSPKGIKKFGGNYEFYQQAKQQMKNELVSKVSHLSKENNRLSIQRNEIDTKKSKQNKYGEKEVANHRYSRLVGNAKKSLAEASTAGKKKLITAKLEENNMNIYNLGLELKQDFIKIPLPEKPFIREKLIEIIHLNFGYDTKSLITDFNLIMKGNDRIALKGNNGCGKTTLLKLILGNLQPQSGILKLNGRAVYLNQSLDLLNPEKSLLENILDLNPGITINEAHKTLANFKFRNIMALKEVKSLSGGELLRGCLAAIFATAEQPDILILDEPTNNLDITSIEILESSLAQYQGALLVVSHDETFLKNIQINTEIIL